MTLHDLRFWDPIRRCIRQHKRNLVEAQRGLILANTYHKLVPLGQKQLMR